MGKRSPAASTEPITLHCWFAIAQAHKVKIAAQRNQETANENAINARS